MSIGETTKKDVEVKKLNDKINDLTDFMKDMYNLFISWDFERAKFEKEGIEGYNKDSKEYYEKQYKYLEHVKNKFEKLTK